MDPNLEMQLREFGFLEPKISQGEGETHKSPSNVQLTRSQIERYHRIKANVVVILSMDSRGKTHNLVYRRIEESLKLDLFELRFPTARDIMENMAQRGYSQTGYGGNVRDSSGMLS